MSKEEGSCVLFHHSSDGTSTRVGEFILRKEKMGGVDQVVVSGHVKGLMPGTLHGCHIHQWGNVWSSKGCEGCGPHFAESWQLHGAPDEPIAHWGDLGNLEVDDQGVAALENMILRKEVTLESLFGRSIVVHDGEDDLGRYRDVDEESAKTGNSGARWACGAIVRRPLSSDPPSIPSSRRS